MEKKTGKANPAEIKRQLEALAGHPIEADPESLLRTLWYPSGASSTADGTARWQAIFLPFEQCNQTSLLDASGSLATGADGKRVFLLSEVVCLPEVRSLAEPINVIATPRAALPFYVTQQHAVIAGPPGTPANDIQITVFAWDANGAAAPNVQFDWRCRAVSNQIIF